MEAAALATRDDWFYSEVSALDSLNVSATFRKLATGVLRVSDVTLSPDLEHDLIPEEENESKYEHSDSVKTAYVSVKVGKPVLPDTDDDTQEFELATFKVMCKCLTAGNPKPIEQSDTKFVFPLPENAVESGTLEFTATLGDDERFLGQAKWSFGKSRSTTKLRLNGNSRILLPVDVWILPYIPGTHPRTPKEIISMGKKTSWDHDRKEEAERIYQEFVIKPFDNRQLTKRSPDRIITSNIQEKKELKPEEMTIPMLKYWIRKKEKEIQDTEKEIQKITRRKPRPRHG
jgi:hypothetical protein